MNINELTEKFDKDQRKAFEVINRRKRIKANLKRIKDIAEGK